MKDWKKIVLPELMQKHCNLDQRGLPIPFVVYIDKNNQSHFKVNDIEKTNLCIYENRCSICGQVMGEDKWLISGPRSALHKNGAYIDTPVHKECGQYALQVCPYLAYSGYTAKTDIEKLQKKIVGNVLLSDNTVDQNRVPLFVFAKTTGIRVDLISKHIYPNRPFKEMEYWNDGIQLSQEEVLTILNNYSKQYYNTYGTDYI